MTVKLGLIGCGGISGAHLTSLAQVEKAKVVAACDIILERAEDRAKIAGGAAVYELFDEMIDKEDLDAIYICTPPTVRREAIEAAVKKGLPVFCEKPASNDLATAEETCAIIDKYGIHVEVGYVLRHFKTVERLKEMLADDRIAFICTWYACPMTLDYLKGTAMAPWFFEQEISGGAIMDQATHTMDLMRHYAGEVVSVAACGTNKFVPKKEGYTVDDSNGVVMVLEDGTIATHGHTWAHGKWDHFHIIYGEKRSYRLDIAGTLTVVENDVETVYKPTEGIFVTEDSRFVDMVEKGDFSASVSDYHDATKTLKLTVRCLEAIQSGKWENV